jgi:glycosyltransferase involved in cell wall biosynthesis
VAFDTGVGDLLADGRGVAVPNLDPWMLADQVAALLVEPEQGATMGAALRRHVREHHITPVAAPELWAVAEAVAAGQPVP